ncbi:hypothetical protein LCGC14_2854300 [marine sediment metagenome]|uniref:Uncharacterized protein n=1 Tax=marine sediment metagenome TaxID=412755 RepID=A0A0F8Y7S5_9ZZZZ
MVLNIQADGFQQDSTEDYSDEQLDTLNAELGERIADIVDGDMDSYYQTVKSFADEVARR